MSGLEVVGAIASITQLGQYSARLIVCLRDLSKNLDRSAERFREHRNQVEELRKIVESLNNTEGIQSEALFYPVESLLKTADSIGTTLRKHFVSDPSNPFKKWKNRAKAIQLSKAEATVLKGFDDLERQKSTLILAILGNFGGLIQRIDARLESGIPELLEQFERIESNLRSCSSITQESRKLSRNLSGLTMTDEPGTVDPKLALIGARALEDDYTPVSPTLYDGSPTEQTSVSLPLSGATEKRVYTGNLSSGDSGQVNGDIGDRVSRANRLGSSQWTNNKASGQSRQVNGDVLDPKAASAFFLRS